MTITAPTPIISTTSERDAVLTVRAGAPAPAVRAGLVDRAVIGLGFALVSAGRAHADASRIGREPRPTFGPHRGAEVGRPFC
jgi:hypothetical protein